MGWNHDSTRKTAVGLRIGILSMEAEQVLKNLQDGWSSGSLERLALYQVWASRWILGCNGEMCEKTAHPIDRTVQDIIKYIRERFK